MKLPRIAYYQCINMRIMSRDRKIYEKIWKKLLTPELL